MAAGFVWTDAEAQQAHHQAQAAQAETKKTAAPFRPKFFTRHEYATVTLLVCHHLAKAASLRVGLTSVQVRLPRLSLVPRNHL